MTPIIGLILGFVFVVLAAIGLSSIFIVKQWQKAVVLRFGKIVRIAAPGLNFRIPFFDSIIAVDLRTQTLDLKSQAAITKDNISVGIDAVVFMKVENPENLVLNVEDYRDAVSKYAQSSIRDLVGKYQLDELLASREEIAATLKKKVDELTIQWGIDVTNAEIQDIALPPDMKRAFAVQAEAEREAKAVKIAAVAELEASYTLKKAAKELQEQPIAYQLRTLQTLSDVSKDQSNTIIFALPVETLMAAGIGGIAAMSSINSSAARERAEHKT